MHLPRPLQEFRQLDLASSKHCSGRKPYWRHSAVMLLGSTEQSAPDLCFGQSHLGGGRKVRGV